MDGDKHAVNFRQLVRLQENFDADPSIENYVALRRFSSGWDTEIHRFAGVDPLQALGHDLEQAGLDRALVCGALGGDDRDIDELCLQLMERLIERKRLEARGATHLQGRGNGISDALVGHLIVAMMEVLQQDRLEPRPSFVLLVREQLGGATTEIYKSHTKWLGRNRAVILGMQIKRRGEQPTIRKIAATMGVQPSTVSRWSPGGDFLEQVEHSMRRSFPAFGEPTMTISPVYLRRDKAAQHVRETWGLPCSTRWLAKLAVVGDGPIFRKAGRTPIYAPAYLDAWAQARIGAPQKSSSAKA